MENKLVTIKHFLLIFCFLGGQNVCEKMAISAYTLKIVEKDPFLRFQMRAEVMFNRHQFFSTNKQLVKIKLMQNETNLWSCCFVFGKDEIFVKL